MKISVRAKMDRERGERLFIDAFIELATDDEMRLFMELPDGQRRDEFINELCARVLKYAEEKQSTMTQAALDEIAAYCWIEGYCKAANEQKAAHILRDFQDALRPALAAAGMDAMVIPATVKGLAQAMQEDRRRRHIQAV